MFTSTNVWFMIGAALILLEFAVPGVVLVFFGCGALVVSLATYLGFSTALGSQLLLFAGVSVLLLFSLRRYIRNRFAGFVDNPQDPDVNIDDGLGTLVLVLEDIQPGKPGRVEFKGAPWTAVSDQGFKKGDYGRIEKIDGLTLTVGAKG